MKIYYIKGSGKDSKCVDVIKGVANYSRVNMLPIGVALGILQTVAYGIVR